VLANVFEAAGLATVSLVAVRGQAERAKAPRALYCDFPLGRPLGKPLDAEYQHKVLAAAFALLDTPKEQTPILVDFPETIVDNGAESMVCQLPPGFDPHLPPTLNEAMGLRAAYLRTLAQTGRTSFGKGLTLDNMSAAIQGFHNIVEGAAPDQAGLPASPALCAADIRAYYEEAALGLADHVPAARQAEAWFFQQTEVGHLLLEAQAAIKRSGAPQQAWFYLTPMTRQLAE
jgi:hypothetical protein